MSETTTIKISEETKKILDELRDTQGISTRFAVDRAVKEIYGKKNNK